MLFSKQYIFVLLIKAIENEAKTDNVEGGQKELEKPSISSLIDTSQQEGKYADGSAYF